MLAQPRVLLLAPHVVLKLSLLGVGLVYAHIWVVVCVPPLVSLVVVAMLVLHERWLGRRTQLQLRLLLVCSVVPSLLICDGATRIADVCGVAELPVSVHSVHSSSGSAANTSSVVLVLVSKSKNSKM